MAPATVLILGSISFEGSSSDASKGPRHDGTPHASVIAKVYLPLRVPFK